MKNNIYSQKSFEQHDIYAKGVDNTAGAVYNVRSSKVAERFLWTVATAATESVSITEYGTNGHNRTNAVCLAMFFVTFK